MHEVTAQHTIWHHNSASSNPTSHTNELTESTISSSDKLPMEEHES